MDARRLTAGSPRSWNPLRSDGTALPPGWLLAAKLLALSVLPGRRFLGAGPPFLPFLQVFDSAWLAPWLSTATTMVFVAAAGCLMCNRFVRTACVTIAGCLLILIAAHRLEYANNQLLTAACLLVIGLYDPRWQLWPLRVQLALVYGGASLNKIFDPDWWSGRTFDTLMINALGVQWYTTMAGRLPEHVAGTVGGILTVGMEATIAAAFLVSGRGRAGVVLMLLFHVAMLVSTQGQLSVPFLYASLAISPAFFDASLQLPSLLSERLRRSRLTLEPALVTPALWWLAALSIRALPRIL